MKKPFCTILILLAIGFSIGQSQLIRSYGIMVGIASTNQTWEFAPQTEIVTNSIAHQGLDAAVFIEWFDIPLLSVVTEIQYIQKKSEFTTNVIMTRVANNEKGYEDVNSFTQHLDYLSIPLLMKFRYDLSILSVYLIAGPRIDFFLSEHDDELFVTSKDYRKENIGGTFGVGLATSSITRFNVGVEFKYNPDFQNSFSSSYLSINSQSMNFLLVVGF